MGTNEVIKELELKASENMEVDDTEEKKTPKKSEAKKLKKEKHQLLKQSSNAKSRNCSFFIGLINFYERYINCLGKHLPEQIKNKSVKKINSILTKVVEKYELKSFEKRIADLNEKIAAYAK